MSNAPDIPGERFTAMTRLDENRAVAQLAEKVGVGVTDVQDLVVWGNHSPTMFPDLFNAKVKGERAVDQVDMEWYENEYMPRVGKRGAEIIDARGASSAASRPTRPSTTCTTGCWGPTGCARWLCSRRAPTTWTRG